MPAISSRCGLRLAEDYLNGNIHFYVGVRSMSKSHIGKFTFSFVPFGDRRQNAIYFSASQFVKFSEIALPSFVRFEKDGAAQCTWSKMDLHQRVAGWRLFLVEESIWLFVDKSSFQTLEFSQVLPCSRKQNPRTFKWLEHGISTNARI